MAMDRPVPNVSRSHSMPKSGVAGQATTFRRCGVPSGWIAVAATCLVVWLLMRVLFFVGITGSDDLYVLRYAMLWDRIPVNGWETRLLSNAMTAASIRLFGYSELASALPSLAASLTILVCVLAYCRRYGNVRSAWWAGLLVAVLPLDVDMATSVSSHTIMSAWMAVGTLAFLRAPESKRAGYLGALCLSMGLVTHLAGVYYVASLVIASLWIDRRRYGIPTVTTALACVVVVATDLAVFSIAFDDPLLRFRLSLGAMATEQPIMPKVNGTFNLAFVLWPIRNALYSKAFGLTLVVVLIGGWWSRRRLDPSARILLITVTLVWVWMSFGSSVPWVYRPFERIMRYLQPASLALAVLFASVVTIHPGRRLPRVVGPAVLAACVLNLLGSGTWDQNVHVSKELLAYVRCHPQMNFVTDYHTLNEMYVANGVRTIPNVATTDDVKPSRLLDSRAARLSADEVGACDAILVNPLNVDRTPAFTEVILKHGDRLRYETQPTYRRICWLAPWLRNQPWGLRKPPARVLDCVPSGAPWRPEVVTDAK